MLTRRGWLAGAAASTWGAAPRASGTRLRRHIEELSVFGRPAGGAFADGVSRVAFSDADVAGRAYVMRLIERAGLTPRIDAAGNILARRSGAEDQLEPVLFGSHIDSVPSGGNFDGDLGSLAAIEIVETLAERRMTTRRPLEIVVWASEEGVAYARGLYGSAAAAGKLRDGELDDVWNGVRKSDAVRKIGGRPERIADARRGPFRCYLELHIEQGGTLERDRVPVGVVEGIVSIERYDVTVRGFANHAGTTPMAERRDALLAASHLTLAVNEVVRREPGRQVGTVGQLAVEPNAPNVIPGEVRMTVELRDLDSGKVGRLAAAIEARAREIAAATRTEIAIRLTARNQGATAAPEVQSVIEAAAAELGLRSKRLPSGAGHDAQMMATLGPMGMIFVPSAGGVSHSPKEWTDWDDCTRGADVLLAAVLAMAG
ncbi:MAG: M20 family metallo-hydrolase [Bryobacteraceae bacterium]